MEHTPAGSATGWVVTVSDRRAAGSHPDLSGPILAQALEAAGFEVTATVVPDGQESVREALKAAVDAGARLVITTGGTGVSPTDRTPEATRTVVDRELPGIPELMRTEGASRSIHACLSRAVAGVVDARKEHPGTLIVNLPGSPQAARQGLDTVLPLVGHVLDQLAGGDH